MNFHVYVDKYDLQLFLIILHIQRTILATSVIFLVFLKDPILGLPLWGGGGKVKKWAWKTHIFIQTDLERSQEGLFWNTLSHFLWRKWNAIVGLKQIFFEKVLQSFRVFSSVAGTFCRLMQHSWIKVFINDWKWLL